MNQQELEQALSAVLVSVAVVAIILGVTDRHVKNLIHAGKLEGVDIGAKEQAIWRVKSESVKRLLSERNIK